jgi:hypothetical protein|tara:strand:- start:341 stop:556 length:216 start_codon:yes stop_codon:yes gene_type:complete
LYLIFHTKFPPTKLHTNAVSHKNPCKKHTAAALFHAARGELMTARAGLAIIIPTKNLTNPPEYVIITLWSF